MTGKNDAWLGLLLAGVSVGAVLGWFYTNYGPKPAQTAGTGAGGGGAGTTMITTGAGAGGAGAGTGTGAGAAAGAAAGMAITTPTTFTISIFNLQSSTRTTLTGVAASYLANTWGIQSPQVGSTYDVTFGAFPNIGHAAITVVSSP